MEENNPHIQILLQLARIDGETSEAEIKLIDEIGKSKFVSGDDMKRIRLTAQRADALPSIEALTYEDKVDLLTNLVLVMRADGRIELREMDFCFDVVKKIGFSETQFFNLVVGVFDKESGIDKEEIRHYVESGLDHV